MANLFFSRMKDIATHCLHRFPCEKENSNLSVTAFGVQEYKHYNIQVDYDLGSVSLGSLDMLQKN